MAAFIPSSSAIIGDIFPHALRARTMSIMLIGVFSGTAAGFLMGGVLFNSIGWRAAFNIYAFAALIGAVITYALLKENI